MKNPSQKIDALIEELDDWRHDTFSEVRRIIKEADPAVVEDWKWMGTPVWYRDGIIACANPLDGNQRRAIDFHEKDKVNKSALRALVMAAISFNHEASEKSERKPKSARRKSSSKV